MTIVKGGTPNATNGSRYSTSSNNVGPDAMTWAITWEMMNRTLEAFAIRNTDSSERGGGKSRKKPSRNRRCLKMTQMDASTHG